MKPTDSFAEFFSAFFLLVNQMPNMPESERIQELNEKITIEFRLAIVNSKSFDTLNDYKVHLEETELNINHLNNRKVSTAPQAKTFSFKVYARPVALPKLFKRAAMPGRTRPRDKLEFKAFGNIFARESQKPDGEKKCWGCGEEGHVVKNCDKPQTRDPWLRKEVKVEANAIKLESMEAYYMQFEEPSDHSSEECGSDSDLDESEN